jgi:hypothetical protein
MLFGTMIDLPDNPNGSHISADPNRAEKSRSRQCRSAIAIVAVCSVAALAVFLLI